MAKSEYNFIYKELVKNEDDILGIIAYSLYKRQKIEYITNFRSKRSDHDPGESDLVQFHEVSNSKFQLEAYRQQAGQLAQEFLDVSLKDKAEEIEKIYADIAKEEIKNSYRPNYWVGVSQGVVASMIFVLLLGFSVIFTWSLNQGPKQVIEQIFKVKIISGESSDGSA